MTEHVKLYTVYDKKAKRYDTPFFAINDLFAERRFAMMITKPGTILHQFKNDFVLKRVASFNVLDGALEIEGGDIIDGLQIAYNGNQEEEDN